MSTLWITTLTCYANIDNITDILITVSLESRSCSLMRQKLNKSRSNPKATHNYVGAGYVTNHILRDIAVDRCPRNCYLADIGQIDYLLSKFALFAVSAEFCTKQLGCLYWIKFLSRTAFRPPRQEQNISFWILLPECQMLKIINVML